MNGTKLIPLHLIRSENVDAGGTIFHVALYVQPGGGAVMAYASSRSDDRTWAARSDTETVADAKSVGLDIVDLLWTQVIQDLRNEVDLIK